MSSSSGAATPGTKNDGSGDNGQSDRKQGLVLGFLGTLPGLITAVAALITAIGGAFLGGTQLAGQSRAQPTVFVTVTATASAASQGTDPSGSAPASSGSTSATVSGTDLSSLTPVQSSVDGFTTNGPQQIGTTTYSDAIRFSCSSPESGYGYNSLVYAVAGYKTLNATFGIPDNASNAAGNSATIKFYKDGGSTELGKPITIALDSPQRITLPLQGSSQLEISCVAAQTGSSGDDIDVAIGDATLSPT
ncbi:MAG TPA: hypothetical protein VGS06_15130 [Streptosporangiaceae bacterium]|nr:hypothetical protein [Streptosporangiaceae bacterium]